MLISKRPAITATGTLNGAEIALTENHCCRQIFHFVKKFRKIAQLTQKNGCSMKKSSKQWQ
jgi:hypothetical protein